MTTFSVRCHQCGLPFPSPGGGAPAGAPLEGEVYECPHCGTKDPYFSADLLRPVRDSRAGVAGRTGTVHGWRPARRTPGTSIGSP